MLYCFHITNLTTLRNITILPSLSSVSSKAPQPIPPVPRITAEIVTTRKFRVVLVRQQVLLGVIH